MIYLVIFYLGVPLIGIVLCSKLRKDMQLQRKRRNDIGVLGR